MQIHRCTIFAKIPRKPRDVSDTWDLLLTLLHMNYFAIPWHKKYFHFVFLLVVKHLKTSFSVFILDKHGWLDYWKWEIYVATNEGMLQKPSVNCFREYQLLAHLLCNINLTTYTKLWVCVPWKKLSFKETLLWRNSHKLVSKYLPKLKKFLSWIFCVQNSISYITCAGSVLKYSVISLRDPWCLNSHSSFHIKAKAKKYDFLINRICCSTIVKNMH